jgi:endo-1,4-beta-xylanase
MIGRRRLLTGAMSLAAMPAFTPAWGQEMRSLRLMAADKGVLFGSATASFQLKDRDFAAALVRDAAILVPEYEMKRDELEKTRARLDFSALDGLFNFAKANGMAMRGHPLVWYYANPPWLVEALKQSRDANLITAYIGAVLGHYRGRLHSVDVVNEAIAEDADGLRPSPWLTAFGPSYIDMAFHAAKAADPACLRVYNDWGCEQGSAHNDRFRAATLRLLDGMLARRVPVQGLGLQAHLSAFGTRVDQRKLRSFLHEIRARGLALLVTELDVDDSGGPLDAAARDRGVADETRRFLDVVLDAPNLQAVLTWGLSDRYLDPPDSMKLKLLRWKSRKLPYDSGMARKPMWNGLAASLAGRKVYY